MLQRLNQPDTENQDDNVALENNQMPLSTTKKVPPQQVARSDFPNATPFIFYVTTERQKRAFFTDAISFTESVLYNSTISQLFEL